MMSRLVFSFLVTCALTVTACASESEPPVSIGPVVAADAGTGTAKADFGDPCERDGRYGDGICDEQCPQPDPDCDAPPRVWCDRSPGECGLICGGRFKAEDNDNCPQPGEHPMLTWECTCLD